MADVTMASAYVVQWKVGDDGKAVYVDSDEVTQVYSHESQDILQRKLLMKWLRAQDSNKMSDLLEKVEQGLITVEALRDIPIKQPELSPDLAGKSDMARAADTIEQLLLAGTSDMARAADAIEQLVGGGSKKT